MTFTPFDLMVSQKAIDLKLGPRGIMIPEDIRPSDRYFSISQLHLVFTDLRNLLANCFEEEDVSLVMDGGPSGDSPTISNRMLGTLKMDHMDVENIVDDADDSRDGMRKDKIEREGGEEEGKEREREEEENSGVEEGSGDRRKKSLSEALRRLDELKMQQVAQRFRYRVKNNHIGVLRYFPPKWEGIQLFIQILSTRS